jgi:hypothetical protein
LLSASTGVPELGEEIFIGTPSFFGPFLQAFVDGVDGLFVGVGAKTAKGRGAIVEMALGHLLGGGSLKRGPAGEGVVEGGAEGVNIAADVLLFPVETLG